MQDTSLFQENTGSENPQGVPKGKWQNSIGYGLSCGKLPKDLTHVELYYGFLLYFFYTVAQLAPESSHFLNRPPIKSCLRL